MTDDYTPTTLVVKHAVTYGRERLGEPRPIKPEAFDRWLGQVRAEAWDEGFADGANHDLGDWENAPSIINNPYRQGAGRMSRDEIIEQATQVMHAEVCCPCDPQGCDWTTTPEARYALALADAGLLARPLPSYDEIVDACRNGMNAGGPFPWPAADAVLALLKGQEA